MLGIICALPSEARHLISLFSAKLCYERHGLRLYKSGYYIIAITGVGTLNTAMGVQTLMHLFPEVGGLLNVGMCGSPNKAEHSIGDIFVIEAIHSSEKLRPIYPDIIMHHEFNCSDIMCFSHPVSDTHIPDLHFRLVDMESYGFAFAANKLVSTHGFQLLKVVSDHLDFAHINRTFVENLMEEVSDEIISFVEKYYSFLEQNQRKKLEISNEWQLFLEKSSLTVSQRNQLEQHIIYLYTTKNLPSVPSEIPTFHHASERKNWFENFIVALYS